MEDPSSCLDLPQELLHTIYKHLSTRIDVLRYRSVCSTWRSSSPPFLLSSPLFPLIIPSPLSFGLHLVEEGVPLHASLQERTVYCLQQTPKVQDDSTRLSTGWLVKIDDTTVRGKTRLLDPLWSDAVIGKFSKRGILGSCSLLDFRVVEVCKEYVIESEFEKFMPCVKKVLLYPNSAWSNLEEIAAVAILNGFLIYWKYGDVKWSRINDDEYHEKSNYDDIILYKGQFYVIDRLGRVSWIDSGRKLVPFSPAIEGGGWVKHLVEAYGDLYVVDRYIEVGPRFTDTVDFRVYRLDQEWGKWDEIKSLDGLIIFIGEHSCFSVVVEESVGCNGNCIYFTEFGDYLKGEAFVFNMGTRICRRLRRVPDYLQIFWPPPNWFVSNMCSTSQTQDW